MKSTLKEFGWILLLGTICTAFLLWCGTIGGAW